MRSPTGCWAAARRHRCRARREPRRAAGSIASSQSATSRPRCRGPVRSRRRVPVDASATSRAATTRRRASAVCSVTGHGYSAARAGAGSACRARACPATRSARLPSRPPRPGRSPGRSTGRTASRRRPRRYDDTDEPVPGAGERDVREPALLGLLVRLACRRAVRFRPAPSYEASAGRSPLVAAQRRREHLDDASARGRGSSGTGTSGRRRRRRRPRPTRGPWRGGR